MCLESKHNVICSTQSPKFQYFNNYKFYCFLWKIWTLILLMKITDALLEFSKSFLDFCDQLTACTLPHYESHIEGNVCVQEAVVSGQGYQGRWDLVKGRLGYDRLHLISVLGSQPEGDPSRGRVDSSETSGSKARVTQPSGSPLAHMTSVDRTTRENVTRSTVIHIFSAGLN